MSFLCLKESRGERRVGGRKSGGSIRGELAGTVSGHKDSSLE